MKIREIKQKLIGDFKNSGSPEPKLESSLILEHVLGKNPTWLMVHEDEELTFKDESTILSMGVRRVKGEPVAYILENRAFWSLNLKCTPDTLIPQPDTEILVEEAIKVIPDAPCRVLDLGTGTGAVALAIKKERKQADVVGSDFYPKVVELAQTNAKLNNLKVQFVQSDWFKSIQGLFEVITANPPYIDENDPHLSQGDVSFEPRSALVAKDNGLADLQTIITKANLFLKNRGWLLVEHGWNQGSDVRDLFVKAGFCDIVTVKDYGGNERVTKGFFLNNS